MQLAQFERDAESFSGALERHRYDHRSGRSPVLDTSVVYDRYPNVATAETFERLVDQPLETKPLRFLREFVATNYLDRGTRDLVDDLATEEASATVFWLGSDVPYRAAIVAQANEPDQGRRHALNELVRVEDARRNPRRLERLAALNALSVDLGSTDAVALRDELRETREQDVLELADAFLSETRDLYVRELHDQLVHYRLDGSDALGVDVAWILRTAEDDRVVRAADLLPAMYRTMGDLGFRLEDQTNVVLDVRGRPTRCPASFCSPIFVPNEVVAAVTLHGGIQDYAALLAQIGRAEQFGCTDGTQSFTLRRLGDRAVIQAYTLLFESFAADPEWLRLCFDIPDPSRLVTLMRFRSLFHLRRAAVGVRYERELLRAEDPRELAERFAELYSEALGVRYFPDQYISEVDAEVPAFDELRGAMLKVQLETFLRQEYDEAWSQSPRAGRFLLDRWREGRRYTAEETSRFLGFDGLAIDGLVLDLSAPNPD